MEIVTPDSYKERQRSRPKRSLRPCDACRKRKTRCIPQQNSTDCVHCKLKGSRCTFSGDELTHSTRSGDWRYEKHHSPGRQVQGQETSSFSGHSPGTVITTVEGGGAVNERSEPVNSAASTLQAHAASEKTAGDSRAPESVAEGTLGLAPSRFAELYGLGSDMEPILMRHRPYDSATHEFSLKTHSIRRVQERTDGQEYPLTFHVVSDDKASGDDDDSPVNRIADAIEKCVSPHGASLVDLFWRHVQPSFPILCKGLFTALYSQSYRRIPAPLLAAVYLCSLRWWAYDVDLSTHQVPDSLPLRRLTRQAISSSFHRPKLSSIQAALLLMQCQPENPLNPDHTYDWGLTCQTLAIGQCLGLHLDASQWAIPHWERCLRKRLSWALFMQDQWTALAYGRPCHIHDEDWMVLDLTDHDFADVDYATGCSPGPDEDVRSFTALGQIQFQFMVRLSKILSSVLRDFYTARASRVQNAALLHEKAKPLLDELGVWQQELPSTLHISIMYHRKLSFHGSLHLSYYGVLMALLRRLIRSAALPPRYINDELLAQIRQYSLQTAQSAINLVNSLRSDHLEAFWYFTSPYLFSVLGSFTTLLLVTSLSSTERNFWQETLNSYLWTLRIKSKSCEPMRYAVNRLEGAILKGLEHALAVNLNEPIDNDTSPIMTNPIMDADLYEFTDFGDWDLAADGSFDLLNVLAMQAGTQTP